MVIAAHPDDADFGPAGTAARWIDEGSAGWLVCCTSGDQGGEDPDADPLELAALRETEQRAAAAIIGYAGLTFLHEPDGALANDLALREQLVREIRTFRPDAVLATDPDTIFYRDGGIEPHGSSGGRDRGRRRGLSGGTQPDGVPVAGPLRPRPHPVRRLYLFWSNGPTPGSTSGHARAEDRRPARAPQPDPGPRRARRADPRVGGGGRRPIGRGRGRGRCGWWSSTTTRTRVPARAPRRATRSGPDGATSFPRAAAAGAAPLVPDLGQAVGAPTEHGHELAERQIARPTPARCSSAATDPAEQLAVSASVGHFRIAHRVEAGIAEGQRQVALGWHPSIDPSAQAVEAIAERRQGLGDVAVLRPGERSPEGVAVREVEEPAAMRRPRSPRPGRTQELPVSRPSDRRRPCAATISTSPRVPVERAGRSGRPPPPSAAASVSSSSSRGIDEAGGRGRWAAGRAQPMPAPPSHSATASRAARHAASAFAAPIRAASASRVTRSSVARNWRTAACSRAATRSRVTRVVVDPVDLGQPVACRRLEGVRIVAVRTAVRKPPWAASFASWIARGSARDARIEGCRLVRVIRALGRAQGFRAESAWARARVASSRALGGQSPFSATALGRRASSARPVRPSWATGQITRRVGHAVRGRAGSMIRPGAGVSRAGSIGIARPSTHRPTGRDPAGVPDRPVRPDGATRCRIANGRSTIGEARRYGDGRSADRPARRGPVRGAVPRTRRRPGWTNDGGSHRARPSGGPRAASGSSTQDLDERRAAENAEDEAEGEEAELARRHAARIPRLALHRLDAIIAGPM